MLTWSAFFYISEWIIRVVMLFAVVQRRRPASALAWLVVVFFAPWVGLVLYWLIGENRLPRRRTEEHARVLDAFTRLGRRLEADPSIVHPDLEPEMQPPVRLAKSLGHMPILGGNRVELIDETDTFIDRLVADIDAASDHVHLLFYIFANDETGRRVSHALERAARRGVTCRVLADAVGSRPLLRSVAQHMRNHGVDLRPALPVNVFRRKAARLDLRNHRKLAVIDGRTGYAGSQNIVNADYGRKNLTWHDLMVRITGPAVLELQAVFASDWFYETEGILNDPRYYPTPHHCGQTPVQLLPSGPNYPTLNYQRVVVAAIHAARERVILTTPYFVPDEALLQAMQTAAQRGTAVDLIVPRRNNMVVVNAASRAYYDDLLDAGVRVHLFNDGLVHAKAMTADDQLAFIGSSNFDIRSFALNFEINLVFYDQLVAQQLHAIQQQYIGRSDRIDPGVWANRPPARKFLDNTAKLLSPLL
jgi:cardiolipin synthase